MPHTLPSAQIIAFPLDRVRPGLRQMMLEADSLISESEEAGEWTARASTIPDLIRSYLPEPDAMFEMTDAEIIKLAQKASALAIHALESGSWQARDHMPFFAALQEYAEGLSAAVAA